MANETISDKTSGYKLFRRLEWRGFGFRSDLISGDYMRRWVVKTPWFLVRLHHIMRGDSDRHFHDHPFDFVSFILRGGYVEHTPERSPRAFKPGDVVVKKATDLHYLKLIDGPAWTLVFTSPYYREWGFKTECGWVKADQYDAWLAEQDAKSAATAEGAI
jgi:hypothetical protein